MCDPRRSGPFPSSGALSQPSLGSPSLKSFWGIRDDTPEAVTLPAPSAPHHHSQKELVDGWPGRKQWVLSSAAALALWP